MKSQEYLERFLELHQLLIHNFLCQTVHGIQTSYYSTNPILHHCIPHLTVFSFKRPGRLYIFFDFGVGVYWREALNREGHLFKKLGFLSNSLLSLGAIQ